MSSEPANGAGLDCDPFADDCGVPTDTAITLRFDRFLLPSSAVRQSMSVYTGVQTNPALPVTNQRAELSPRYDLIERSVRYVFPAGFALHPKTLYTIELPIYTEQTGFGFRAFDGAPLEGSTPVRLAFFTGLGPAGAPAPSPAPPACDDVLALFDGCLECHGALGGDAAPHMGLSLDGWDDIQTTAIAKVAHQTEIGETTGVTNEAPLRFGVNMPIIDPERPDNSYLMYKLLLRPEAYEPGAPTDCEEPESCSPPDGEELERLRAWFVRGEPMPETAPGESFIDHAALASLQSFIRGGAACP
ncbi:MAG TPA: hypothetical protein VNN72_16120 [Polyangiaceae bacterium]|nr:hypothetical protein [Polyangiaceae bacterium]